MGEHSRLRVTAGLLFAVLVSMVGPIQRAVSHESETYIEIAGPLFPDGSPYEMTLAWTQSKRGAEASWQIVTSERRTRISLLAAVGDDASATLGERAYRADVANDRRAILHVSSCTSDWYSCKSQTWRGADTFTHDLTFETAIFVGTLVADDGGTCDVNATWRARSGHNVRYHDSGPTHPRTRAPATLDVETSCVGTHRRDGPDEAEMWTDHIVTSGARLW